MVTGGSLYAFQDLGFDVGQNLFTTYFFAKLANISKHFLVCAMFVQSCQDFSLLSPLLLPLLSSSRCRPAKSKGCFQDSVTAATA